MSTQPARGMRDFLPDDVRRRQYVMGVMAGVYESYGFAPLETPAVENIETLLGKYGEEGDRLIFKILKRGEGAATGEADLALRYDLTVPLARVVAEYRAKLPKYFKRYQMQPVWRADRPQKGRFREFYQCDVDAIGSTSAVVEAELCAAVSDVLVALGFNDFKIVVSHRALLTALLKGCGIPESQHSTALVAIDKIDKVGREGVDAELCDRGIDAPSRQRVLGWVGADWRPDWLDWLEAQFPLLEQTGREGIENLRQIINLSDTTSAGRYLRVEPALARGLSYYTGAIFEIKVPDLAGSLGGGGRYDGLIGRFSKTSVAAAGFSLGLERILVVMSERGMFPVHVEQSPTDVLVVAWGRDYLIDQLRLATELRAKGLRVEVFPDAKVAVGKQFQYGGERGIPFACVVGQEERLQATVQLKDLRSGEKRTLPQSAVAVALLSGRPNADGRPSTPNS